LNLEVACNFKNFKVKSAHRATLGSYGLT
jgi:hypothetical protein